MRLIDGESLARQAVPGRKYGEMLVVGLGHVLWAEEVIHCPHCGRKIKEGTMLESVTITTADTSFLVKACAVQAIQEYTFNGMPGTRLVMSSAYSIFAPYTKEEVKQQLNNAKMDEAALLQGCTELTSSPVYLMYRTADLLPTIDAADVDGNVLAAKQKKAKTWQLVNWEVAKDYEYWMPCPAETL